MKKLQSTHWTIWKAISRLEENKSLAPDETISRADGSKNDSANLTERTASILRRWAEKWAGLEGWQSFLNKTSLEHEIEESLPVLRELLGWLNAAADDSAPPVIVVDCCCGKGVLSMLISYLCAGDARVSRIFALDKATINWDHIRAANAESGREGRPQIELWGGTNLFEHDAILDRLEGLVRGPEGPGPPARLAMLGIHLCKNLGPAFLGLANCLGPVACPFVCLMPCCLPRQATSSSSAGAIGGQSHLRLGAGTIEVASYERERWRRIANNRTRSVILGKRKICYYCRKSDHAIKKCPLLPSDVEERTARLKEAAASIPCWKCGEVGHKKTDCKVTAVSRPPRILQPMFCLDVSRLMEVEKPFDQYCEILKGAFKGSSMTCAQYEEKKTDQYKPCEPTCLKAVRSTGQLE